MLAIDLIYNDSSTDYVQIEGAALIGIDVAKEDDLGEWYSQVVTKGQMISYYDVSWSVSNTRSLSNKSLGFRMVKLSIVHDLHI